MILSPYDVALARREEEHRPIRVAMVGAGSLARMLALQLIDPPPAGVRLVAIVNRTPENALKLLEELGATSRLASTEAEVVDAIRSSEIAVTGDPKTVVGSSEVDVILEATGSVDFALSVPVKWMSSSRQRGVSTLPCRWCCPR